MKSRHSDNTPTAKKSGEPHNEFLNLKLRQTSRDGSGGQRRSDQAEPKVDFGVKLRSAVSWLYRMCTVCVSASIRAPDVI